MDASMTLVAIVVSVAAQVSPAPVATRTKDPAVAPLTPASSRPSRHRIQLVRATDKTPIGGAEIFDVDFERPDKNDGKHISPLMNVDGEFPCRGDRTVADGDGFVEIGPGRRHSLLACAPGWFQLHECVDLELQHIERLELLPDEPVTIELRDVHGDPVEGARVQMNGSWECGIEPVAASQWHATSDRLGRVSFPHYVWWVTDDFVSGIHSIETGFPLEKPSYLHLARLPYEPGHAVPFLAMSFTWDLPPLSKLRVEFVDAEGLPPDRSITFEVVGGYDFFEWPDRFASDHGRPVELPTGTGARLRALFHWLDDDPARFSGAGRLVLGQAATVEGATSLLRVPMTSDPVALRIRPALADGTTIEKPFVVAVEWTDARGFRWRAVERAVVPDATGALRIVWRRPRIDEGESVAALHVAIAAAGIGVYFTDLPELASRDVPWPTRPDLDVGTLIVPSAK